MTISIQARNKAFNLSKETGKPLDLTNHLPFRVAVVSNLLALNRDWKIRELSDLEPREMRVLINIGSYMPIKSADIAYQCRLDSYTVSRAVKKLSEKQLIEFQQDSANKNIKNLTLNDKGKELYRKLSTALDVRAKEVESVLSVEERDSFFDMLARIEQKSEQVLAQQALDLMEEGLQPAADQKELIRWFKRK